MKVLVTGGCGLIGYHAAIYYHKQGHQVEVMDNLERSSLLGYKDVNIARVRFNKQLLQNEGIVVYPNDVSKKASFLTLSGHDVIIHMAGQCGVPTSIDNPRRDFEVNTVGTLNVLEYARQNNSIVVLASTNKVYPLHTGFVLNRSLGRWEFENLDWKRYGFPKNETLIGARTPYGNSKYMADLLCQEYAHTYGLRTGVFRMSCIYGPNQILGFEEQGWAVFFIIAAMKGWPITIYGDGCQVRDMLYVEDTVKAYDAFIRSNVSHGVWNLGGGVNNTLSLNEHLDYLEGLIGKKICISYKDWRPLDQKCYVSDIRPVTRDLNWIPIISSQEGLKITANWITKYLDFFND